MTAETTQFTEVVDVTTASEEVYQWLGVKRVTPHRQKQNKSQIDELISAVQYGQITFDFEKGKAIQKLIHPVKDSKGEAVIFDSLELKFNITVSETYHRAEQMQGQGLMGANLAISSALSGKAVSLLSRLDPSDLQILQAYCVFFMLA